MGACRTAFFAAIAICAACGSAPERVEVAYPDIPSDLHPHRGGSEYAQSIGANVYEALAVRDAELSVVRRLARSWQTPDERTWVVQLEPDVRFHDGTPLHAEHVVRSVVAARSDPRSFYVDAVEVVESVTARDPLTVELRTKRPLADLPGRLAYVAICLDDPRSGPPLGTGPFRIETFQPGARVELRRFAGYHGAAPAIRELAFSAIPDPRARLDALRAGEVHVVPSRGIPLELFDGLSDQPEVETASRLGVRLYYLVMDTARDENPDVDAAGGNPFRDVRVRRAVSLAVDRQRLASRPDVRGQALDQLAVPEAFGYNRELAPPLHDPEAARRLLAEAGHPDGFDVTLDIAADSLEVLAPLRDALGAVGIRVRPRAQRIGELLDRVRERATAFAMMSWIATAADLGSTAEYLLHTPGESYGRYNGGGWSQPEADALIEEAAATLDAGRRARLLLRLSEIVAVEVPVVPLLRNRDSYALRRGLRFELRLDRRILGSELRWE